jgi:putative membrane protein
MQFLKTVLWVLVAVLAALFARANWNPVTLNLWGDIQADIKIPLLMLITFLIGFLPTWLIMRARLWTMRRRLEALDRQRVSAGPAGAPAEEESEGLGI